MTSAPETCPKPTPVPTSAADTEAALIARPDDVAKAASAVVRTPVPTIAPCPATAADRIAVATWRPTMLVLDDAVDVSAPTIVVFVADGMKAAPEPVDEKGEAVVASPVTAPLAEAGAARMAGLMALPATVPVPVADAKTAEADDDSAMTDAEPAALDESAPDTVELAADKIVADPAPEAASPPAAVD